MPEEVNRVVTDSLSDLCFTTSAQASRTLLREGKKRSQIYFVGNTMVDSLRAHRQQFRAPALWREAVLQKGKYLVLTLHRPSNVDQKEKLAEWLRTIVRHSRGYPIIFPVHPRTAKTLRLINMNSLTSRSQHTAHGKLADKGPILTTPPLGYLEFNYLVENAKAVITDSGGITEEATVMGVPCLTLRDTTERPETVTMGTNELIGVDPEKLGPALKKLFGGRWKKGKVPPKWDGKGARRIIKMLEKISPSQKQRKKPSLVN
jgi:UDP-N-acetylglucosamine 2-epimerase (non-hydrolysing)